VYQSVSIGYYEFERQLTATVVLAGTLGADDAGSGGLSSTM